MRFGIEQAERLHWVRHWFLEQLQLVHPTFPSKTGATKYLNMLKGAQQVTAIPLPCPWSQRDRKGMVLKEGRGKQQTRKTSFLFHPSTDITPSFLLHLLLLRSTSAKMNSHIQLASLFYQRSSARTTDQTVTGTQSEFKAAHCP